MKYSRRSFMGQALALTAALFAPKVHGKTADWNGKFEALIALEINQPEARRYNRPYIAVWLENSAGKSVRTLAVWVQPGKGSRWYPDLRRWFGSNSALVDTISSPTRMPGKYNLVWDGKSDKGALLDQGEYYVCIEAAREHGTYQLIREKLSFANTPFKKEFKGNIEIKEASLEFRARSQ
jgi:FAD:protein FMN transferase